MRGLNIKAAKTRLVKSTEGFDFLGWHFAVKPNGKYISHPSKDNYKALRQKVKEFDGDLNYWSGRNSKLYENMTAQALKRQDNKCGICGLKFTSEERVHLHHVDGNHNNWRPKNLLAIHESCHDYLHQAKAKANGIGS